MTRHCLACGLVLRKFTPTQFKKSAHWAFGPKLLSFRTGKLGPDHTADLLLPTHGQLGDNLVCNARCAHRLLVTAVRAIGYEDFAKLLPAVPEARKRVIAERYKPSQSRQRESIRAFADLLRTCNMGGVPTSLGTVSVGVMRVTAKNERRRCDACCANGTVYGIRETPQPRHRNNRANERAALPWAVMHGALCLECLKKVRPTVKLETP